MPKKPIQPLTTTKKPKTNRRQAGDLMDAIYDRYKQATDPETEMKKYMGRNEERFLSKALYTNAATTRPMPFGALCGVNVIAVDGKNNDDLLGAPCNCVWAIGSESGATVRNAEGFLITPPMGSTAPTLCKYTGAENIAMGSSWEQPPNWANNTLMPSENARLKEHLKHWRKEKYGSF
jgi:hypothetical protein